MRMYLIHIAFCILIFSSSLSGQSQNNPELGGLAGPAMRLGFGARGLALGNAMTAVITGDIASYYNPAALPYISSSVASASYGMLSLDRKLNFLAFSKALKPNAGISLSVINSGTSKIDGRNRDGVHTEDLSTSENSFMLSFGLKPAANISLGITVKILYYKLYEEVTSTTAAIDIGAMYLITEDLSLGFVLQDFKAKYKWETGSLYGKYGNSNEEKLPLRKRVGLCWQLPEFRAMVSGEFEQVGKTNFLKAGAEIGIVEQFSIRGGIDQIGINNEILAKPSCGIAFDKELSGFWTSFQYAYVFEPYAPSGIHILSLALRWK